MKPALIGTKIGMTRITDPSGEVHPVTVIKAGPCVVLQVKRCETDGYMAVQLGFEDVKPHRSTLPMIGHAAKAGTGPKRVVREMRLEGESELEAGQVLTVEGFEPDDVRYVDVTAVSKGRGFSGVMRRHGFGGQPASHGTERKHRSPGSIGGHASGNRGRGIKKGLKMAGRMGHTRNTIRNQRLVKIDKDENLLLVRGSVPGPNGGMVLIRQAKTKA